MSVPLQPEGTFYAAAKTEELTARCTYRIEAVPNFRELRNWGYDGVAVCTGARYGARALNPLWDTEYAIVLGLNPLWCTTLRSGWPYVGPIAILFPDRIRILGRRINFDGPNQ